MTAAENHEFEPPGSSGLSWARGLTWAQLWALGASVKWALVLAGGQVQSGLGALSWGEQAKPLRAQQGQRLTCCCPWLV